MEKIKYRVLGLASSRVKEIMEYIYGKEIDLPDGKIIEIKSLFMFEDLLAEIKAIRKKLERGR